MSGPPELPPPGLRLEMLISQLTPAGALTWRALPTELPWTRPPGGGQPRRRPNDTALSEALESAGVKDPVAREYILAGPFTEVMVHSSKELARNHGLPARAIEVAVEHDIIGSDLANIATRVGLTDHEMPLPGQAGTVSGDPRGGRRYLKQGRSCSARSVSGAGRTSRAGRGPGNDGRTRSCSRHCSPGTIKHGCAPPSTSPSTPAPASETERRA
jgi:hypothetical protein